MLATHLPWAHRPQPRPLDAVRSPTLGPLPATANVLHVPRPAAVERVCMDAVTTALEGKREATVTVADPAPAAAVLTAPLAAVDPDLAAAIAADVAALTAAVAATLPTKATTLRAKLEIVTTQSCPRFHADSVGCRALVTYAGGGTLYAPSCAVCRARAPVGALGALAAALAPPAPVVQSVDTSQVVQTRPWDVLLLKGSAHPDAGGVDGAVHASPPADVTTPRLLLTVDDVPVAAPGGCGAGCAC